jgi:hypothetical protein
MSAKQKTYPDQTFERAARAAGASVSCLWEIKGPAKTKVAWITCYAVNGCPVMVKTYTEGNGWTVYTTVYTAAPATNQINETTADALGRCGVYTSAMPETPVK